MTQYNFLNLKLFNSEQSELKWRGKNGTEVTLFFSSNVIGESTEEANFPHKLLLTDTQVLRLHKAFANGLSADIKLSKT